jgi:branched-chain amino acid transport system substrate-binding protein
MKHGHTLGACVAGMLLAFGSGAQAQETLTLGVHTTLSGAGAAWGLSMQSAAELAAEDVNARGGLDVNGTRYMVEVVAYDDRYLSSEAITAMTRMIFEDDIKFVVGPLGSAPAVAVLPLTTENEIITMTMAFTDQALTENTPFMFRPVLPSSLFAQPQVEWVVNELGATRIAGLFPNDESGQTLAKDTGEAYEAAGAEFVVTEFFERERTDLTPLLTRILASDADAIELDGNAPATAGLIVKQARELGWDKPIIRTGGDATAEIIATAGADLAEGVYVHQALNIEDPKMQEFIERWKSNYRGEMNAFTPFFYVNALMLFEAIETAGTVDDTTAVRDALREMENFDSVLGPVSWTGKERYGINHQFDAPFYVGQIRDGAVSIVATCNPEKCE